MPITKKSVLKEVRDVLLFILVGVVMTYFFCTNCRSDLKNYIMVTGFTASLWMLLWKGHGLLAGYLSRKIPWVEFPVKRMLVGIITTVGYTVLVVVGVLKFFESIFHISFGDYSWTLFSAIVITFLIALTMHSRAFLHHWRLAKVDAERFEKESISAKYEALKSQVNPHFLFNSLNALSNLVYEDQDKAVKFIKQLSDVYRYVLDTKDREVVMLEEELKFLRSYVYLQQIRFGDKLNIQLDLNGVKTQVAPLSMQMLVENAIKHNIVSEQQPLSIKIYHNDDYLVVENNLQRKEGNGETSGLGLENISRRYDFLTNKKVLITQDDDKFVVQLPLIETAIR